jgi:hypothetical protein
MLEWMLKDKGIEPHVSVWEKPENNPDRFNRSDFIWDRKVDCYHRASQHECKTCELKPRCCPNTTHRKISRSIYEDSRDVARAISQTPEYRQSRRDRKKVEVLLAHFKRIMKLDRLRLRGLSGARDEFLMAATVQNLKKLAQQRYKPPDHRIGTPVLC